MITNEMIESMSLIEYLEALNKDSDMPLTTDLSHWADYGVTTAGDLAEYLDGCVELEREKGNIVDDIPEFDPALEEQEHYRKFGE